MNASWSYRWKTVVQWTSHRGVLGGEDEMEVADAVEDLAI